jgi:hypothetical protein
MTQVGTRAILSGVCGLNLGLASGVYARVKQRSDQTARCADLAQSGRCADLAQSLREAYFFCGIVTGPQLAAATGRNGMA